MKRMIKAAEDASINKYESENGYIDQAGVLHGPEEFPDDIGDLALEVADIDEFDLNDIVTEKLEAKGYDYVEVEDITVISAKLMKNGKIIKIMVKVSADTDEDYLEKEMSVTLSCDI